MRYVRSRLEEYQRDEVYRIFITDSLRLSVNNFANQFGGNIVSMRYSDFFKSEETKTADEIIENIRKKLKE